VGHCESSLVEGELHRGIEIHDVRRYRLRRTALTGERAITAAVDVEAALNPGAISPLD
jgi:hypothetical protein